MSVQGRILNVQTELSAAEAKIARYILDHSQDVLKMTVSQLADAAGSSPASVIRLTKSLDIGSFTTMKILLSSDLTKGKHKQEDFTDITKNEQLNSIKEKLLTGALQSIHETTDQLNEKEVKNLVKAMTQTKHLFLFGVGASYLTAENISQKWNRIGYLATADIDLNALLPKITNADQHDIVWLISNSGESPEVIVAAKTAKDAGIKVVSLTKFGNNSLAKLSDIALHTSQPIETQNRIAATNSLLTQFMLVDIIFYYFVSRTFDKSKKALDVSHGIIQVYKDDYSSNKNTK